MNTTTMTWNKGSEQSLPLYIADLQALGLSIIQIIITRQTEKFNQRVNETTKYLDTTEALIICTKDKQSKPNNQSEARDFINELRRQIETIKFEWQLLGQYKEDTFVPEALNLNIPSNDISHTLAKTLVKSFNEQAAQLGYSLDNITISEEINIEPQIQKAIEEVLPIHKRLIISSANTSIGIGNILILESEQIQYINDDENFIVYTHEGKTFEIEFYAYTWLDSPEIVNYFLTFEEYKELTKEIIQEYIDRDHAQALKDTVIYDLMTTVNDKLSYKEIEDYCIAIAIQLSDFE